MDQRAIKDSDLGSRAGAGKRRSSSCFVFFLSCRIASKRSFFTTSACASM